MSPPSVGVHWRRGPSSGSPRSTITLPMPASAYASRMPSSSSRVWPTQVRWRHRGQRRLGRDPAGHPDRRVAGRAAGAVRHGDERRPVRLELADRLPELLLAGLVAWAGRTRRRTSARRPGRGRRSARACWFAMRNSLGTGTAGGPTGVHWLVSSRVTANGWDSAGVPRPASRPHSTPSSTSRRHRWRPLGGDAARLVAEARTSVSRRQALPGVVLLLGPPRRRARRPPTRTRWSAPARRSSCCTPAPWSTTTCMDASDTRRGRPATHRAVRGRAPRGRLARRPGAVRRGRGDPARRPAAQLVRRAAAPLRAADHRRSPRRSRSSTGAARR